MIQKIKSIIPVTALFALVPVAAFAQEYFGEVDTFFKNIGKFIDGVLIPLVFTLALLVFLWGMFKFFILGGDNEEARAKGKRLILWSIIGFVMMVSIWGIVNVVSSGLIPDTQPPKLPGTPTL